MNNILKTLDYGNVIIHSSKRYVFDDLLLDIIEDGQGRFYEIYKGYQGNMIAVEIK